MSNKRSGASRGARGRASLESGAEEKSLHGRRGVACEAMLSSLAVRSIGVRTNPTTIIVARISRLRNVPSAEHPSIQNPDPSCVKICLKRWQRQISMLLQDFRQRINMTPPSRLGFRYLPVASTARRPRRHVRPARYQIPSRVSAPHACSAGRKRSHRIWPAAAEARGTYDHDLPIFPPPARPSCAPSPLPACLHRHINHPFPPFSSYSETPV
ncbi:hypothetical protein K438DRAFT_1783223 [Mycena galopus ATCC 62051]|nr:hypothetical protein K438DRAFT_1783223 [Mycena galopus ATCC 62051]